MKNFIDELHELADPKSFNGKLRLNGFNNLELLNFYKDIFKIRYVEEVLAELCTQKEIQTPIHLGIGQEAIAVGVSAGLTSSDKVYSGHRGHSHYLALGAPIGGLLAEVLGKSTGVSKGMGGSMHLISEEYGFHGSVPIVAATIPIAVGASIACQMSGEKQVSVSYFGDGACEEGVFHESLNLASVMNLPVIFVCENNFFSSHLDIHLRQPSNRLARFAEAHKIRAEVVDGNDVVEMARVSKEAISRAREGNGPTFIEAITYRWCGHVGPNIDLDVGVRRSKKEILAWKKRDPLGRLRKSLLQEEDNNEQTFIEIEDDIKNEVKILLEVARKAPIPQEENLLDFVLSGNL